ncbi:endonuclease/exonuclease/phosphatase family protein [Blastomonas sp.]|uniref:endonuclease/exonuclease/phosphatase family protein n=1 Tax=Blastomonas sp. TaxID=1909299 RepID=UPI002610EC05|nr:endonuclease/exonuclease/phosphatase family protein [Blastomonas sp.]MDM7956704.1 metal-dependent hydrolase [Blastomonas sp.]
MVASVRQLFYHRQMAKPFKRTDIAAICGRAGLAAIVLATTGCTSSRMLDRHADCVAPTALPTVRPMPQDEKAVRLSVLIYNVEGLPWPARKNREPSLRRIGETLQTMRAKGTGPDVVMLQEAFTPAARHILVQAGYANIVSGPGRRTRRSIAAADIDTSFKKARKRKKGERFGRLLNSGLYIASDLPLTVLAAEPFSRRACAGFDCLANKGALVAEVHVGGMPQPLVLLTTHLNSQRAARVSLGRAREAHGYQIDENALLLDEVREPSSPLILGGDFNMRGDISRFEAFANAQPYRIVHEFCISQPDVCAAKLSFDGDEPWLDTQDLQAYDHGRAIAMVPVEIAAMFDGLRGERLSDHDGLLVTYEMRWPSALGNSTPPVPVCSI